MLKIIAFIINLSLIAVISFKIPKENMGLSSFATKSNLLGSPASAQRFLNRATAVGILIYFGIAFQLNLFTN
jgi:preprotein translocase subunit SecG